MAYYNNNDKKPQCNVYSPIVLSNPDSEIFPSRLSISYFNKVMVVSIDPKNADYNSSGGFVSYAREASVKIYLSASNANLLALAIKDLFNDKNKTNVAITTNIGIIKVSKGAEYNSSTPCISITTIDQQTEQKRELIYQTKTNYNYMYNYDADNTYSSKSVDTMEMDIFLMALEQYYLSSSYAIASSVANSNFDKSLELETLLRAMGTKLGVSSAKNANYSYTSNSKKSNSSNDAMMHTPEQQQSFEEFLDSSMNLDDD